MKSSAMFKPHPLAMAISAALLGQALPAAGQTETPAKEPIPAPSTLQTVIVTAQGRRENILKIPYNISSLSGDDLADHQIVNQSEMLRGVAGASVVDRGARNSGVISGITIRGLNVNDNALGDYQLSAVPTVSTYVNNTPIFANFLIKDIDRVEVLRGPQGTLYGSGSMGGTLRYITRRPDLNSTSGSVETTLSQTHGSSGTNWAGDGVFNLPLSDQAALRFVGGTVHNAGVIDYRNVYVLDSKGVPVAPSGITSTAASYRSVKDADTEKTNFGRVSLLFKPSVSFSGLLTYQNQTDDSGGRRQPTRGSDGFGVPYGEYENGSIQLEPSSRKADLTSLELDWDLGFATLTSGSSHYDQSGSSVSENTGFYAKNGWLANYYFNYPRPMAKADRTYSDKAFVQELRLVSKPGGAFDYAVGAFYMDQKMGASQYSYLRGLKAWADVAQPGAGVTTDNDFVFERQQRFKEKALYGELTWPLSDALRVTGGLRRFKTDFSNDSSVGSGVYSQPLTNTSLSQGDSGTLYKANIAYDVAPQLLLYSTLSQGYRRGGANVVPLTGTFAESAAFQTFQPDRSTNAEIGFKGRSGDTRYSVSVFHIDWKDIQLDTATPNWGFYAAQNGGKARSQGLELELSGRIGEAWRYGLGYAYIDAKLTEDVGRADDRSIVIAKEGTRLPGSAKNTLNALLEHTLSTDAGYWTNSISAYYQGSTENSVSSSPRFKQTWSGFSLWNLSSTYGTPKWSATLWAKNVFNNDGVTGGLLENYMGTSPSQNYDGNGSKVFISQPRTIGLTGRYSF